MTKIRRVFLNLFLLGVVLVHPAHSENSGPSFDCLSAQKPVEKVICRDPALAQADREMAILYQKVLAHLPDEDRSKFRQAQKDWLHERDTLCVAEDPDRECLKVLYTDRIDNLHAMTSEIAITLCEQRELCDAIRVHTAGVDAQGNSLQVIHLCSDPKCPTMTNFDSACFALECGQADKQEYWLTVQNKTGMVRKQLLMTGHLVLEESDPGFRETLSIGDNKLTYHRSAGLMCRISSSITLRLSPLRIDQESSEESGGCGPSRPQSNWNWEHFSGEVSGHIGDSPEEYSFTPIPMVRMSSEFVEMGWKNSQLGTCALTLENGGAGYVIYGSPIAADHPRLKMILISPKDLIVQIRDQKIISGSPKWLYDDHLELWLSHLQVKNEGPNYNSPHISSMGIISYDTYEEVESKLYQWGVRISDGQVFPAYGNPPWSLKVDRVEWADSPEGQVMMKITFPFELKAPITVSYSDGNDGEKVDEILSSSQLRFGDVSRLGGIKEISSNQGTCAVQEGLLNFVPKQFKSDEPVIDRRRTL